MPIPPRNPDLIEAITVDLFNSDRTYTRREAAALYHAMSEAEDRVKLLQEEMQLRMPEYMAQKAAGHFSDLARSSVWRQYVFAFMRKGIEIDVARQLADEAVAYEERRSK